MQPESSPKLPLKGMWHIALKVSDLEAMKAFYVGLLGYVVEWAPDPDNLYLSRGRDNLALHRDPDRPSPREGTLDHLGFVLEDRDDVDRWAARLQEAGLVLEKAVKTHRDGARSFYLRDPDGNLVQFLWHPPLAGA